MEKMVEVDNYNHTPHIHYNSSRPDECYPSCCTNHHNNTYQFHLGIVPDMRYLLYTVWELTEYLQREMKIDQQGHRLRLYIRQPEVAGIRVRVGVLLEWVEWVEWVE